MSANNARFRQPSSFEQPFALEDLPELLRIFSLKHIHRHCRFPSAGPGHNFPDLTTAASKQSHRYNLEPWYPMLE
jgi:hypothetical protein